MYTCTHRMLTGSVSLRKRSYKSSCKLLLLQSRVRFLRSVLVSAVLYIFHIRILRSPRGATMRTRLYEETRQWAVVIDAIDKRNANSSP
mmetsp:Transcript_16309/g.31882  ORF Transcript_16309/g.31882 Transcript_16309/m.31882 type:complete len:89 (+) Transcript_16309:37-303(+)